MQILHEFEHELVVTVMVTIFGAIAMYPINAIRKAYKELQRAISSTHAELVHQRENCLQTIQADGKEQVKLLGKAVDTLGAMHLDQRQLLGKLDK